MIIKYKHLEEWINDPESDAVLDFDTYLVLGETYIGDEITCQEFSDEQDVVIVGGVVTVGNRTTSLKNELKKFLKVKEETEKSLLLTIRDMTREYIENNGNITCSISTDIINKEVALELIRLNDVLRNNVKHASENYLLGQWKVLLCETCFDYDSNLIHLEIC